MSSQSASHDTVSPAVLTEPPVMRMSYSLRTLQRLLFWLLCLFALLPVYQKLPDAHSLMFEFKGKGVWEQ